MAHTEVITQSTGTATVEEWAKLDLDAPNSRVLRLTRVRRDDNSDPVVVEEVVLALERFPGLAANGSDVPDIVELAQRHGLSLGNASEHVSFAHASREVASHLQIAPGADVLR
jgi:DNA-binding GntR family transcriptional regulator